MLDRAHLFAPILAIALASSSAACTKTEGTSSGTTTATTGTGTGTSAPTGATATATPSASPSATETAAASASAAAPTASATASAGTKTTASAAPSASAGPAECGTKPLPDCPLQAWMKANTNSAVASGDLPALATALDKTATFAPAGYTNWATISKDGAKAAKAGDLAAAKASCRTCHDQYKTKYKTEMRARKI